MRTHFIIHIAPPRFAVIQIHMSTFVLIIALCVYNLHFGGLWTFHLLNSCSTVFYSHKPHIKDVYNSVVNLETKFHTHSKLDFTRKTARWY